MTYSSWLGPRCLKEKSRRATTNFRFWSSSPLSWTFFFWRETKDSVELVAASYGLASVWNRAHTYSRYGYFVWESARNVWAFSSVIQSIPTYSKTSLLNENTDYWLNMKKFWLLIENEKMPTIESCLEFLYKQCTSSLPLFQRNTNKQTIVSWNSFGHSALLQSNGLRVLLDHLTEEGHCCPKLFQLTIVCLLVLRWKRGRELVHCLYKNSRHVYQPPVGPQNLTWLLNQFD